MQVPGTDHAYLVLLKARGLERKRQYQKAHSTMKMAIQLAMNTDFIHKVELETARVYLKMSPLERLIMRSLQLRALFTS
jgi:hypothetical protein